MDEKKEGKLMDWVDDLIERYGNGRLLTSDLERRIANELTPGRFPEIGDCRRNQMIGLSPSCCVEHIRIGQVAYEDVEKIIAATKCEPEHWDQVFTVYRRIYWIDDPDTSEEIARRLLADGKIEQPRINDKEHPGIASSCWL